MARETHWRRQDDTVAAMATGSGGALAVVRLTGPQALEIGARVWQGASRLAELPARTLTHGLAVAADGAVIDRCLVAVFHAPASYTGEDLVEFHTHGGVLVPRELLLALLKAGAGPAAPGDFTRRAFVNGKLDLTQAEAVADVIAAQTTMALHVANRQLAGVLGRQLGELYETLTFLLAEVESRLDFPEENLDWLPAAELLAGCQAVETRLAKLLATRREGEILRGGVRLVIAGPPNVGKSSLLNAILGRDRAIVTALPGTTRDTLEELAHIRGLPVRLIDTAGIREAEDVIERHGVERSMASLREAQLVLWVVDAAAPEPPPPPREWFGAVPVIWVANKIDLPDARHPAAGPDAPIGISALTGDGFERLYDAIETAIWQRPHGDEPECAVAARHAVLLDSAVAALAEARAAIEAGSLELAAVPLRGAAEEIGRITGRTASVDVLETIFGRFCIGK